MDSAAYRIVQESLTNALRHAGPVRVTVHIDYREKAVIIDVVNDGRPGGEPVVGHGITGMRERAAAVGGSLRAGFRPEGGFRVTAELPVGRS